MMLLLLVRRAPEQGVQGDARGPPTGPTPPLLLLLLGGGEANVEWGFGSDDITGRSMDANTDNGAETGTMYCF